MKKSLGLKICASILMVPIFAMLAGNASAAELVESEYQVKLNGEDIYASEGESGENEGKTATYDAATDKSGVLTLNGYNGGPITTNLPSLTINVTKDSTITGTLKSLTSTGGSITITGTGKLTLANGIDVAGAFTQDSGELALGTSDITAKGKIKLNGKITAGSIIVNAKNPTEGSILIGEKANIAVSKSIIANYTDTTTAKGIELTNVCASPATSIINVTGTGTTKTSTVFSTDGIKAYSGNLKVASSYCTDGKTADKTDDKTTKDDTKNPDTLDAIYYYVIALVASSAILIYRRHLAKR